MQAYDNVESSVRKAAVFCIVSLHQLVIPEITWIICWQSQVGEATLQPHLDCLNGSKMKLLSLYIKRAQASAQVLLWLICIWFSVLSLSARMIKTRRYRAMEQVQGTPPSPLDLRFLLGHETT